MQDHVLQLVRFEELDGHPALARAHAYGHPARFVQVGRGKGDGLPRPGGQRADGHVAEDDRINPVQGRRLFRDRQLVPLHAQGKLAGQEHPPEGGADVEGVALGVEGGVGHLADAAHDDVIERTLGVQVGPAAALDGAARLREQGKAAVRVAYGPDSLIGADLLAHAAAHAGGRKARLLTDDRAGERLAGGFGPPGAGHGERTPLHGHLNGVERARGHAGAAQGAALGPIVDLPAQIVDADVLCLY